MNRTKGVCISQLFEENDFFYAQKELEEEDVNNTWSF